LILVVVVGGNAFVSFMSHTIGDVEVMDSIVPSYRWYDMIYVFISQSGLNVATNVVTIIK